MDIEVSIIIPCYNVSNYLQRCVNSILNQTYSNFEVILVNDGSKDNIIETFNTLKLDNRFHLLTKKNEGSGFARNYGLKYARGKYIYFMDPDDKIDSTLLEDNLKKMKEHNADLTIFGHRQVDSITQNTRNFTVSKEIILKGKEAFKDNFYHLSKETNIFSVCNKMYSHEFIKNNKLSFTDLPIGQDAEFNWKLFKYVKCAVVIPKIYYTYYTNRKGSARTEYNKRQFSSELKVLSEMKRTLSFFGDSDEFNTLIKSYKLNIIYNEIKNLNKNNKLSYNELKDDNLFHEVKYFSISDFKNRKSKIKLIVIKSGFLYLSNFF